MCEGSVHDKNEWEGEYAYVHDAGVDVSELLEAKEPRAVLRVIEDVGLRLLVGAGIMRLVRGVNTQWWRRWGRRGSSWPGRPPALRIVSISSRRGKQTRGARRIKVVPGVELEGLEVGSHFRMWFRGLRQSTGPSRA